jgi:cytochrome c oxidase subunit 5a
MSHGVVESDAEFDARYEAYFNRPDIDGWEYRKAMSTLAQMDLVPEPAIVAAALRACRRLNDVALATRTLEVVKVKCAPNAKELWPYMLQELQPTLDELGINTLEEMGYEQPELALPNPFEIH